MRTLLLLFLLFFASGAFAGVPAFRAPQVHYKKPGIFHSSHGFTGPEELQKPLDQLDLSHVPEIKSSDQLNKDFAYVRDTRFLQSDNPQFPRRLTWLYPDDGCYARAELMAQFLIEEHEPAPMKLFAFGDLEVQTANSDTGSVTWWYHVTVAFQHAGQLYVLDPAIEPSRPLTAREWGQRMGMDQTEIQFTLCPAQTVDPDSDCVKPTPFSRDEALDQQNSFLDLEWERLLDLNRDPKKELGDEPPWLATTLP